MSKFSHAILLLPAFALFAQLTYVPANCVKIKESPCCMNGKMPSKCMKGTKQESKPSKSPKTCVDCPMFTITVFQPLFHFEILRPFQKIEFAVMLVNNLSDYYSRHWKPPAVA